MSTSRQLATIMQLDIVGNTALMGRDSAKALELVRSSEQIQKHLVKKHQGQWLREMDDGALAKFGAALNAVKCAIDIQRASRADFEGDVRKENHSGNNIIVEDNDVYGDGVNIASHLQFMADSRGIYLSESIEKTIIGQSKVQAKYLGDIKLKSVSYDVRTHALQRFGLRVPEVRDHKELSGHFLDVKSWSALDRVDKSTSTSQELGDELRLTHYIEGS